MDRWMEGRREGTGQMNGCVGGGREGGWRDGRRRGWTGSGWPGALTGERVQRWTVRGMERGGGKREMLATGEASLVQEQT